MASPDLKNLSPLSRLAMELDGHFLELSRLGGQIERLDIDSESGLERSVKVLNQFAQHATDISVGIQDFAKVLQETRERSEQAANLVAERAQLIHERKQKQNQIRDQLHRVKENVTAANRNLAGLKQEGPWDAEGKAQLKTHLERINHDLKIFLADTQAIKETASQSNFKSIEHEAKTLLDALRSSSQKIDKAVAG